MKMAPENVLTIALKTKMFSLLDDDAPAMYSCNSLATTPENVLAVALGIEDEFLA
jgi:hypothetical protein